MSRASAQVYKDGKLVAIGIYCGTSDVLYTGLCHSAHVAFDTYRTGGMDRKCTCGKPPTKVIVYSDYGGGFWWESEACLNCMAVTGELDPLGGSDPYYEEEREHHYTNGKPPCFVDQWEVPR